MVESSGHPANIGAKIILQEPELLHILCIRESCDNHLLVQCTEQLAAAASLSMLILIVRPMNCFMPRFNAGLVPMEDITSLAEVAQITSGS